MKNYKTDKVTYLSALPRTWGINSQPRFNSHTTMYKHVLHVKQLPKRFHCPSAFILRTLTKTSHWKYKDKYQTNIQPKQIIWFIKQHALPTPISNIRTWTEAWVATIARITQPWLANPPSPMSQPHLLPRVPQWNHTRQEKNLSQIQISQLSADTYRCHLALSTQEQF